MSRQIPVLAAALMLATAGAACAQDAASPSGSAPQTASTITAPKAEAVAPAELRHGKKDEYTGPTEIIVLAPTPMLDEEGKQRVDPDGKPMFNPPVKQQRDKHGHPLFDEGKKPVFQTATELGYDEKGHKLHAEKVRQPKTTHVSIARGTFTVDGVIAKAELNYEIADLKFLYFYVPGNGVTVVSNQPFPGAKEQTNAFEENTLTVRADDHVLQLASDKRLLDKKPETAFVMVDRSFSLPSPYPVVGYGNMVKAPYQWPGSRANKQVAGAIAAPPVPRNLEPVLLLTPCPAGQMRLPALKTAAGAVKAEPPCVPMAQAQAAMKTSSASVPQMPVASRPADAPASAQPVAQQ